MKKLTAKFSSVKAAIAIAAMTIGAVTNSSAQQYTAQIFSTYVLPGSGGTLAQGIDGNTVVGYYLDSRYYAQGFIYNDATSTFRTLNDPLAVMGTYLTGVSGNNVVGYYVDGNGYQRGFVYNGSTFTNLPTIGTTPVEPLGISGTNIVGRYYGSDGKNRAFEYNGSTFTLIDDPLAGGNTENSDYTGTIAYGVSGSTVVGSFMDSDEDIHGFIFDGVNYTTVDILGTFQGTVLRSLSNGTIIGDFGSQSFIDTNGVVSLLPYSGLILNWPSSIYMTVTDISSTGQIAGYFGNQDYETVSFILTPVPAPEPATIALVGIAGGFLLIARKQSRS